MQTDPHHLHINDGEVYLDGKPITVLSDDGVQIEHNSSYGTLAKVTMTILVDEVTMGEPPEQEEAEEVEEDNGPDAHYKFPNGVETADITDYLDFNAGNAVKYLTRACRADGKTKGITYAKRIDDLRKAKWYLERATDKMIDEAEEWAAKEPLRRALAEDMNRTTRQGFTVGADFDLDDAVKSAMPPKFWLGRSDPMFKRSYGKPGWM